MPRGAFAGRGRRTEARLCPVLYRLCCKGGRKQKSRRILQKNLCYTPAVVLYFIRFFLLLHTSFLPSHSLSVLPSPSFPLTLYQYCPLLPSLSLFISIALSFLPSHSLSVLPSPSFPLTLYQCCPLLPSHALAKIPRSQMLSNKSTDIALASSTSSSIPVTPTARRYTDYCAKLSH